jgi:hypothetical protein
MNFTTNAGGGSPLTGLTDGACAGHTAIRVHARDEGRSESMVTGANRAKKGSYGSPEEKANLRSYWVKLNREVKAFALAARSDRDNLFLLAGQVRDALEIIWNHRKPMGENWKSLVQAARDCLRQLAANDIDTITAEQAEGFASLVDRHLRVIDVPDEDLLTAYNLIDEIGVSPLGIAPITTQD